MSKIKTHCIFKYVLFIVIFGVHLNANEWDLKKEFTLKKDQIQNVLVTTENSQKLLVFRWTLFKNEGLVFLYTYDDNVVQTMLYQRHRNRFAKIIFQDVYVKNHAKPYMLLKFDNYDYETQKARLVLFLKDKNSKVKLKFIPKEAT